MARLIQAYWPANPGLGLRRGDARGCTYEAYLPDPLVGRDFTIGGELAADIADAERAIGRLNRESASLVSSEGIARLLFRAEAVASSHIEGLQLGARRLLRAEAQRGMGVSRDVSAVDILGNIDAMRWVVETTGPEQPIAVVDMLEVHRQLLAGTRLEAYGGKLREEQNWIGRNRFNPCGADFVPPPPEHVARLMEDLAAFCSLDHLPAVMQAAIAHAQFETIHPFVDGNGRAGRALIHMIFRRRGLAPRVVPPVSLVLATWSDNYVRGLAATRYTGDSAAEPARRGLDQWLQLFAGATLRAVNDALSYEARVAELRAQWLAAAGNPRRGSAAQLLIDVLAGAPVVTVKSAAALIGRSFQATSEAIDRLVAAGVLSAIHVGKRNRAFEARAVIDVFTDLERQLASPRGDTAIAPPKPARAPTTAVGSTGAIRP
ncbi:MAG: Fic family protein [Dehalococcoidia bacterium]|nr:Fic family protein [Dehalococcoidia bacterium]